jgi:hypothetical protein
MSVSGLIAWPLWRASRQADYSLNAMRRHQVHTVLGDTAGHELALACSQFMMPGEVVAIPDDLSNGPLDDGQARSEWFRAMRSGYDETMRIPDDAFQSWDTLGAALGGAGGPSVVVWSSGAVSDRVFLRMACWRLRAFPGLVTVVDMTNLRGAYSVGVHAAKELAHVFPRRRRVEARERAALADDFVRLRDSGGTLRSDRDGRLVDLPVDAFDGALISFADPGWKRAVAIVADCLSNSAPFDCIGDMFFSWRIQRLIA